MVGLSHTAAIYRHGVFREMLLRPALKGKRQLRGLKKTPSRWLLRPV